MHTCLYKNKDCGYYNFEHLNLCLRLLIFSIQFKQILVTRNPFKLGLHFNMMDTLKNGRTNGFD